MIKEVIKEEIKEEEKEEEIKESEIKKPKILELKHNSAQKLQTRIYNVIII